MGSAVFKTVSRALVPFWVGSIPMHLRHTNAQGMYVPSRSCISGRSKILPRCFTLCLSTPAFQPAVHSIYMKVLTAHFMVAAEDTSSYPVGGLREVAFAGRSNVGKSSMINALLGRRNLVRISKTPGRTRKLNFFLVNNRFVLVDLPGYGFAQVSQAEKSKWASMIETYFKIRNELAGVVLIVDSRRVPTESDREMIGYLGHYQIPFILAATKADKLTRSQIAAQKRSIEGTVGKDVRVVIFSARSGQGKTELWQEIKELMSNAMGRRSQVPVIPPKNITSDHLIAKGQDAHSKLLD